MAEERRGRQESGTPRESGQGQAEPAASEPGTSEPAASGPGASGPVVRGGETTSRSRWWLSVAALGAAAVLLLWAVFPLWTPGWVAEWGTVPWWVAAPALLAVVLLLGGLGGRGSAWGAAVLALVTGGLALINVGQEPAGGLREFLEPRPVAPAGAALAALLAAALCVVVAWRGTQLPPVRRVDAGAGRATWLSRLPSSCDRPRDRARRLLAVAVAGGLVGTLLGTGASAGADRVHQALTDDRSLFDAVSEPVPDDERTDGVEVTDAELREIAPDFEPDEVLWQETLPGPAELTTCVVRQPDEDDEQDDEQGGGSGADDPLAARSTLVTVEEVEDGQAVVGYDTADGAERWRYTVSEGDADLPVPAEVPSRLGQVGVSELCTVHVTVDPFTLVTLDGASGEVLGETLLPTLPRSADRVDGDPDDRSQHWRFVTESRPDDHDRRGYAAWQPLVRLSSGNDVFLESPERLVRADRRTGEMLALSLPEEEEHCRHLVSHRPSGLQPREPGEATVQTQSCVRAMLTDVAPSPDLSDVPLAARPHSREVDVLPEGDAPERLVPRSAPSLPDLGCDGADVTDLRRGQYQTLVAGHRCYGDGHASVDGYGDPVLIVAGQSGEDPEVLELPEGTELPLQPHITADGARVVWLDRGTVYLGNLHNYSYDELYSAEERVEAVVPPEAQALNDDEYVVFYAVTGTGDVQRLEYRAAGGDDDPFAPVAEVAGGLDGAAGTCAGSRDLKVDRAGLKLLALCETSAGTEVTAVTGERLAWPEDGDPHRGR